jgi:perosamine synthetase
MSKSSRSALSDQILNAVISTIGSKKANLHEPSFKGRELEYLNECIESTYVSSVGKFVELFSDNLSKYTQSKYVIPVVNGTSALHLALLLAGVEPNDEVLIPTLTFIGTANPVAYCQAIPHFVDSEASTLGIDPDKLDNYLRENTSLKNGLCVNRHTDRVIRAVVPMHTFGHPTRIFDIIEVAKKFKIKVVEDAAESLGSFYKDQHTGTFGLLGILSFNGNKTLTTGGGGAILTNDETLAKKALHLSTTARVGSILGFTHDEVGFNYRMPNLNAALGCAQLENIEEKIESKRDLFLKYQRSFSSIFGVAMFTEPVNCRSNYWLQTMILDNQFSQERDLILRDLNSAGFGARSAWGLLHEQKPYLKSPRMDLSCAENLVSRIINIPSSPGLVSNV